MAKIQSEVFSDDFMNIKNSGKLNFFHHYAEKMTKVMKKTLLCLRFLYLSIEMQLLECGHY